MNALNPLPPHAYLPGPAPKSWGNQDELNRRKAEESIKRQERCEALNARLCLLSRDQIASFGAYLSGAIKTSVQEPQISADDLLDSLQMAVEFGEASKTNTRKP